jgi:hypothetical protein
MRNRPLFDDQVAAVVALERKINALQSDLKWHRVSPFGRERERVSQPSTPGTVLPMMPITLRPISQRCQ